MSRKIRRSRAQAKIRAVENIMETAQRERFEPVTIHVVIDGIDAEEAYSELISRCRYMQRDCIVYRVTGQVHIAEYYKGENEQ